MGADDFLEPNKEPLDICLLCKCYLDDCICPCDDCGEEREECICEKDGE